MERYWDKGSKDETVMYPISKAMHNLEVRKAMRIHNIHNNKHSWVCDYHNTSGKGKFNCWNCVIEHARELLLKASNEYGMAFRSFKPVNDHNCDGVNSEPLTIGETYIPIPIEGADKIDPNVIDKMAKKMSDEVDKLFTLTLSEETSDMKVNMLRSYGKSYIPELNDVKMHRMSDYRHPAFRVKRADLLR